MTDARLGLMKVILVIGVVLERPYIASQHRFDLLVTHELSIDSRHSFLLILRLVVCVLTQLPAATSIERSH